MGSLSSTSATFQKNVFIEFIILLASEFSGKSFSRLPSRISRATLTTAKTIRKYN